MFLIQNTRVLIISVEATQPCSREGGGHDDNNGDHSEMTHIGHALKKDS